MFFNNYGKFTNDEIIKSIEENLVMFSLNLGKGPKGEIYASDNIKWVHTGNKLYNRAFAKKYEEDIHLKINEVVLKFQELGAPLIWIDNNANELGKIGDSLIGHNFNKVTQWPGMALDLNNPLLKYEYNNEIQIEQIRDHDDLKLWSDTLSKGFGINPESYNDFVEIFNNLGLRANDSIKFYLARKDGFPVGTTLVFFEDNIAGLYFIATPPDMRKQGIATQIVMFALEEAKKMGGKLATLQATEAGRRVYSKIGFQEYCQFKIYLMKP